MRFLVWKLGASLFIKAEGGLPLKRFIEGGDVTPNLSELLNCECKCIELDFHDIDVE